MATIIRQPTPAELQARIDELERRLAEVERTRHAFDAPHASVTLSERRRYEFVAALAKPRQLVNFTAHNRETGATVTCADYSATQLERGALQFSRLVEPRRRLWHGNRSLYGVMLKLFVEHGAVVRHHGRGWSWAVWPGERRAIAAQVVTALSPKSARH